MNKCQCLKCLGFFFRDANLQNSAVFTFSCKSLFRFSSYTPHKAKKPKIMTHTIASITIRKVFIMYSFPDLETKY